MASPSMLFVVLMGIGTVFFGLICIIFLTWIMGKVVGSVKAPEPIKHETRAEVAKIAAAAPKTSYDVPESVVAAILAALSEEPGISSHGYHITSIKKLS